MSAMTTIPSSTILAVLKRENFTCRRCGAKCPEHLITVDRIFKNDPSVEPGSLTTYCTCCHNEYFTDAPITDSIDEPLERREQFLLLLESLKEKGNFRKDQAKEICEYFNCKLGGSKIPAERRIDIERTLRVKDAVDVLDTLEDAYYNKVKFIDGIVPPASYAAFIDAIPRYLSTSHQCDLNKQLRIIRGGCSTKLPGYDPIECYRYLLEYKMALESVKYKESEIMKDLVENVSQLDKASHSFDEWKNAMDRHRSQMLSSKLAKH